MFGITFDFKAINFFFSGIISRLPDFKIDFFLVKGQKWLRSRCFFCNLYGLDGNFNEQDHNLYEPDRNFYEPDILFYYQRPLDNFFLFSLFFLSTDYFNELPQVYFSFSLYFSLWGGSGDIFFFTIICVITTNRTVIYTNRTIIYTNRIVVYTNRTVIFTNRTQNIFIFSCLVRINYGPVRKNYGPVRINYK